MQKVIRVSLTETAASQGVRKVSHKPPLPMSQGLPVVPAHRYEAIFLSLRYAGYWVSFEIIISNEKKIK